MRNDERSTLKELGDELLTELMNIWSSKKLTAENLLQNQYVEDKLEFLPSIAELKSLSDEVLKAYCHHIDKENGDKLYIDTMMKAFPVYELEQSLCFSDPGPEDVLREVNHLRAWLRGDASSGGNSRSLASRS